MGEMSVEDRINLARAIVGILDGWGVAAADQVRLLALPEGTRPRALRRFREDTPFPEDARVNERVEHLAGIADALRTSYPHSVPMRTVWMRTPNRRFGNRTPLAAMLEDGLEGVIAVRCHLDCSYDWDNDPGAAR